MYVFGYSNAFYYGRIWCVELWQDDEKILDLIPCRNSSNVLGMYDKIGDTFYYGNRGTGKFKAGPEI